MEKTIRMTSDNAAPKRTVEIANHDIEMYCKRILGWRSSTAKYKSMEDRLMSSGSSTYDRFIEGVYQHQNH